MKSKVWLLIVIICFVVSGIAEVRACTLYTTEQQHSIERAYIKGLPHDLGYTLASIVIQESFVGSYIVRVNSKDGEYGSYGITHIELRTAMWLEGYESSWRAKQDLVPKLISDDDYAMDLAITKLLKNKSKGWLRMWSSYNGRGSKALEYGNKIKGHIAILKECYSSEYRFLDRGSWY